MSIYVMPTVDAGPFFPIRWVEKRGRFVHEFVDLLEFRGLFGVIFPVTYLLADGGSSDCVEDVCSLWRRVHGGFFCMEDVYDARYAYLRGRRLRVHPLLVQMPGRNVTGFADRG